MPAALSVLAKTVGRGAQFGKPTLFFEELAASAEDLGTVLTFLTEQDDGGPTPSIAAYRFDGGWRNAELPSSALVYDRFLATSTANLGRYERLLGALPADARFLNPPELVRLVSDKQVFHDFLRDTGMPVLPSFLLSDVSKEEISFLLGSVGEIYLKPSRGLRGERICVVSGSDRSGELRRASGELVRAFRSVSELHGELRTLFPAGDAVLMPRATGSRLSEAPFDVRVLVQSIEPGSYAVTGMGARIGERGTWVSNLAAGGGALTIEELAVRLPGGSRSDAPSLRGTIEALSLGCAQRLEDTCGAFVDVAVDLVLDARGWVVLEANAKPGRWLFTALADRFPADSAEARRYREIRRRSVEAPLLFAKRLSRG
jgi:glutathione synthase/RimK-type ligase-like ATP-grasp enzyme